MKKIVWRAACHLLGLAPVHALEMVWERLPGRAKDVAVGANGSVWIVGTANGNGDVFRWDGAQWLPAGGSGVLIAVGPQGDPWVVDLGSDLYHRVGEKWVQVTERGSVTGIGVGADGTVLAPGGTSCFCGALFDQNLYQYSSSGGFVALTGKGTVIEPDSTGWWVLDAGGKIFRWTGGPKYLAIEGRARDISVGANGDLWIIGGAGVVEAGNDRIYRWNGAQFERASTGQAARISVGPTGQPWVVSDDGQIFRGYRLELGVEDSSAVAGEELRFPVSLSYPSDRAASVAFRLDRPDGSLATNGVLSFPAGATNRVVVWPTARNPAAATNLIFRLTLESAVGADLVRASASGTVNGAQREPPVLTAARLPEGGVVVRCPTQVGFSYLLQRWAPQAGAAAWVSVTASRGTGDVIELGDSARPIDFAAYRVTVTPGN